LVGAGQLGTPKAFDLITDPKGEYPTAFVRYAWVATPAMKIWPISKRA
jgi:hypothetical protein